jgi:hypothetical protein
LEAKTRFPGIEKRLAELLKTKGNHVHYLTQGIVSFPTKHDWRDKSDLRLIRRSAQELLELVNKNCWESVIVPRPGCNNGGLEWETVKNVLEEVLDDRFTVITNEASENRI